MPFHKNRVWQFIDVAEPEELAAQLTTKTWTLCTAFRHRGYFYLNDSTHEDGAAEYAIVKAATLRQVESITFGWCDFAKALQYINEISAGKFDAESYGGIQRSQIQMPSEHGRCPLCA